MPNRYYQGPPSDHFDGVRFFNPGHAWTTSLYRLLQWRLFRKVEPWPTHYPSPYERAQPPQRVMGEALRVTFIGHASYLYQTGGLNILIDPVWSERVSPFTHIGPQRVNPPGIDYEKLPPIDVVLITHNHYDHLDLAILARLWEDHRPRIITPLGNDVIMSRAIPGLSATAVDWGNVLPLSESITLHVEPALHWSARGLLDRRHALWASFVIDTPAGKVLHACDTGFGDGQIYHELARRHPTLRLAALPIGAYEPRWFMKPQHINPAEAVQIFQILQPQQALGHHWGTFHLSDEAIEQPLKELAAALQQQGIEEQRFLPVRPGQVWEAS